MCETTNFTVNGISECCCVQSLGLTLSLLLMVSKYLPTIVDILLSIFTHVNYRTNVGVEALELFKGTFDSAGLSNQSNKISNFANYLCCTF